VKSEFFFKDSRLPFVECRYTRNSSNHYKPHLHNTLSIGAIDSKKVLYSVADTEAILKPGSLAIINPHTLHSCNPLTDESRSYYMLYLETSWCKKIQHAMFGFDRFIDLDTILLKDKILYHRYIETMDRFIKKGCLLEKEQMIITLVEEIFRKTIPKQSIDKASLSLDITSVKKELCTNLSQDVTLQDIAKKLKANSYTLLRNFKKETGTTPHHFRLNIRIEQSKKLLQEGEKIAQVALKCGFYDQSHFQKYFLAITATTPKEYQYNFRVNI